MPRLPRAGLASRASRAKKASAHAEPKNNKQVHTVLDSVDHASTRRPDRRDITLKINRVMEKVRKTYGSAFDDMEHTVVNDLNMRKRFSYELELLPAKGRLGNKKDASVVKEYADAAHVSPAQPAAASDPVNAVLEDAIRSLEAEFPSNAKLIKYVKTAEELSGQDWQGLINVATDPTVMRLKKHNALLAELANRAVR